MKHGAYRHLKIKRLRRALDLPTPHAVGLVEMLFHITAEHADRGDVGRLYDDEIAEELGWKGDPGALVSALVHVGWLDPHPIHRFVVHDWPDHAPEFIQKRIQRRTTGWAVNDTDPIPEREPSETEPDYEPDLAASASEIEGAGKVTSTDQRQTVSDIVGHGQTMSALPSLAKPSLAEPDTEARARASPARASPVCVFPDDTTEMRNGLARWLASKPEIPCPDLDEAIETIRDWANSNGKRKRDWLATCRNAIRDGWAVKARRASPAVPERRNRIAQAVEEDRERERKRNAARVAPEGAGQPPLRIPAPR